MNRTAEQRNTEIAETLKMLDALPGIEVSPRFRANLMRRIESTSRPTFQGSGAVAVVFNPKTALIALLLLLNIASAMLLFMHGETKSTTGFSGGIAESFSQDFGGAALSYYDDQSAIDQ